ncbi:uncharacterized protein LOC111441566 [Cucurbita moschata]|uniref:Uncharacterized protein LOC111441566 n=1 Tax=Cucurbita moschata TaxID=3662 RepID=A0A6J1F7H7_CUCMO|nr:uncharacterized protein LOC111441566 [Cucurbita moschata]
MGRPEPYVLFAQTFAHPHLDEYVDEVLFAEPVVITACEFIEQNASSTSQAVALAGATLPPSFAVEVFVQCEGETRFRRLCQPFLYSHSSSNVLEVEAIVSNHLVVRGSYRSLSLVIYGNTAEDLGQFNIGLDDSSLNNPVTSAEGNLEDLPLALHSNGLMFDEPVTSLMKLSLPGVVLDIPAEVKQFLQLMASMLEQLSPGDAIHKILVIVISAASSYVSYICERSKDLEGLSAIFNNAKNDLLKLCKAMQDSKDVSADLSIEFPFLESEDDLASSKQLVDILSKHWNFNSSSSTVGCPWQLKNITIIFGLSVALFLCSAKESCFHFVNGGGMEQIVHLLSRGLEDSTSATLLLLAVIEQATQHSFGCEGLLGWWPREDENVPSGASEGYSQLLNLLLQKPRHDIASLATRILQRLSFYEVASRYECAILSVLEGLSSSGRVPNVHLDVLISMKSHLKKILNLINLCGPIQDPSPPSCAVKSLFLGQTDGLLTCKATSCLISSSKCRFSQWDADPHLLALLKERGFFPLSAALLSSSIMRSEESKIMDVILEIVSSIEAIILSLLFCRSGLIFLLHHSELSATIIHALRGDEEASLEECMPIRYASTLITNNFFCKPSNVAMIVRIHLRVVTAIDRLLLTTPNSEEFLWVLWELCSISRSDCGRQALLALTYFPEAIVIFIESLRLVKEPESGSRNSGALPLNLAISHSAAEIFEVIVTDSTASSLDSWIVHAMELYKALHSSPPGSNRKDAPTRLLEWIDAGVVYHKSGAVGLLRYAAVLASGGDANSNLANTLVSELTDLDNAGEPTGSDVNVMDNLGKTISEKTFDGITLRDSSIAQLTTAFQILAYISENSTVAAALYDEGAVAVIYAVLVDSRYMLERCSNNYDYLVDEGTECNSTSDLLLERNREQSLVNLLLPCLVLLLHLLQTLQVAKEEHRNSKLMNALVRLHREVSPKLAACAFDLSTSFPNSALGFGAVCHLLVSVLACWPVYGWSPGLFSSLLDSVQATSLQALGPKETCSLLCLLNDLFPDEGIWLWKNGMPLLSAVKKLGIRTLLGPQMEDEINWYLESGHQEKLLGQLSLQLEKISQVVQHYAISTLVVIQDMLRIFIIRLCCHKADSASFLLRPIFLWIRARVSDLSSLSDIDAYKICRYLDFFASLLEHPRAKALLLNEGAIQLLIEVSHRCLDDLDTDEKLVPGCRFSAKCGFSFHNWCLPVFKSFSLLCYSMPSLKHIGKHNLHHFGSLSAEDYSLILHCILLFCQVLPVGKELVACLAAFRALGSCSEGQTALASILIDIHNVDERESQGHKKGSDCSFNVSSWRMNPPLLCCWKKLLISIDSNDYIPTYAIQAVDALSSGSLSFCLDGSSLVLDRIGEVKFLYGLPDAAEGVNDSSPKDVIGYIQEMIDVFKLKLGLGDYPEDSNIPASINQILETAESLLLLLEKPTGSVNVEDITLHEDASLIPSNILDSLKLSQLGDDSIGSVEDNLLLGLGDKFMWECPEILPYRLNAVPAKRKMSTMDGQARRARGENSPAEISSQNTFARGPGISTTPSLPSRRDTFRQRKPNTSRPPSMHVDDYVARERNVDGAINSNVISIQRVGSSSGRPPSIHVDEFMARQRERQNPVVAVVGEAASQVKGGVPANDTDLEKLSKPKQLKTDLDDDLQGIDIVFDGEDSDPDDKLPFPHLDNTLQQSDPMLVEQGSPRSIVEETESNGNDTSQFSPMGGPAVSNVDENTQSEFSSRMSVSRPQFPLARESSVSSGKKYFEHPDDGKNAIPVRSAGGGVDTSATVNSSYNNATTPPSKFVAEPRVNTQNYLFKNSPQHLGSGPPSIGSQGFYEQRFFPNQPPLPPVPPPPTVTSAISQPSDLPSSQSSPFSNFVTDAQQRYSTTFHGPSDYPSGYNSSASFSSGSVRPPPPLPPTPPPLSSSPHNLSSSKIPLPSTPAYNMENVGMTEVPQNPTASSTDTRLGGVSASGVMLASNSLPALPHLVFSRPSMPVNLYGGISTQQQNESSSSILPNLAIPPSSMPSMHSLPQLQPLQPPQLPRPPQPPPQHLRPPIIASQQPEQVVSMQGSVQMQMHQLQMLQQPRVSPQFYQSQPVGLSHAPPQQQFEHPQHQAIHQPGDAATASQQQQDSAMSLHEYFKSPEAIQSLLSDREKLCQLLEQHPKLMQMLQERLGQR